MTRKVINISFALFTFFKFILPEYVQNMSRNILNIFCIYKIYRKDIESIFCTYSVYILIIQKIHRKDTESIFCMYSAHILYIYKYTKKIRNQYSVYILYIKNI